MELDCPSERRKKLADSLPVWPRLTLHQLHERAAAAFPNRPMILAPGFSASYREAANISRAMASGLIALGLEMGDHIALVMANLPEFALVKLAIARAGCVAVPINYALLRAEMAYVLGQSDSHALIAMDSFRGRDYTEDLAALAEQLPALRRIIVRDSAEISGGDSAHGFIPLAQLASHATPESDDELARREAAISPDDLCDIVYTSGTTGHPKGVMLTHDMVLRSAYSSAYTRAFEDGRRIQFALPMYHVFAYVECFVAALFVGGAIIPHALFDPLEMLDAAEKLGANDIVCVPLMAQALIEAARKRGFSAPSLHTIFNSGGVCPLAVWDDLYTVLGAREVHTAYGMTETTASISCTLSEDPKERLLTTNGRLKLAGAAGDASLGGLVADFRVVDPETGAPLPPDTDGELQLRGPVITKGYYRKPEETAEAFTTDGWFRTGDVGRRLDGGYLKLTGRTKETYRCGGETVMPREIEDLLARYPGVGQVLAVGVPDTKMGEVGCLCVVPQEGAVIDCQALIAHCTANLARFKVPKHVLLLQAEDIPLTATGRPQKFKLAALAKDRLGLGG